MSAISTWVLMAFRNRLDLLLHRSLPSLAQQQMLPSRLVIVNDGYNWSRDDRQRISAILRCPVTFLKNVRSKGAAGAWNTGLMYMYKQHFTGYVGILDDDDQWDPIHLSSNYDIAVQENADVVISGLRKIVNGTLITSQLPHDFSYRDFLVGNPGWQGSNTFVRFQILLEAGGFRDGLQSMNDRDLAIRILHLPNIVVKYTQRWTATWFLETNRPSLSQPRSASKLTGLRQFWQIYHHIMNENDKRLFFGRSSYLFGISKEEILSVTEVPTKTPDVMFVGAHDSRLFYQGSTHETHTFENSHRDARP